MNWKEMSPIEIIREFMRRVDVRAQENMEKTGKLEGAHYAAMKVEFSRLKKELERTE